MRLYHDRRAALPAGTTLLYYRLRQVDADGSFAYSPVRTVARMGAAVGLNLYPNPAHGGAATLSGAAPGALVQGLNALGREVLTATADANGTAALALPTRHAPGVYVVRVGATALRLVVELIAEGIPVSCLRLKNRCSRRRGQRFFLLLPGP